MRLPAHRPDRVVEAQRSRVGDPGPTVVGPRWPEALGVQVRILNACQRVRGLATPYDLWRAVLASVLGTLSVRRLGAWAVCIGLADLSQAAGRKRLRTCHTWLLWVLREVIAVPETPAGPSAQPPGRVLLVDVSPPPAAERRAQVMVTDAHTGEKLAPSHLQPGAIGVADNGSGERCRVAEAVQQQAHVVRRITPTTLPLATTAGAPVDVLRRSQAPPALHCPTAWAAPHGRPRAACSVGLRRHHVGGRRLVHGGRSCVGSGHAGKGNAWLNGCNSSATSISAAGSIPPVWNARAGRTHRLGAPRGHGGDKTGRVGHAPPDQTPAGQQLAPDRRRPRDGPAADARALVPYQTPCLSAPLAAFSDAPARLPAPAGTGGAGLVGRPSFRMS
jgi:hypothetical protein